MRIAVNYTSAAQKSANPASAPRELPVAYGEDALVLLARDPWWGFVYWEITEKSRKELLKSAGPSVRGSRLMLRVYDLSSISHFNIPADEAVGSRYLELNAPGHRFCVEIGYLTGDLLFFALARSNEMLLPRAIMAESSKGEWMEIDHALAKIYKSRSDAAPGGSSEAFLRFEEEARVLLGKRLKSEQASGLFGGSGIRSAKTD